MSQDSLHLFNTVPMVDGYSGKFTLIPEYGVLVTPEAAYDLKNIQKFLKETGVGASELNSSFWNDWRHVAESSDGQLFFEQILHYFSTYGLEYFGVDSVREGYVYIPNHTFNAPSQIILKVIGAENPSSLVNRCFKMLNSGMALSQETIKKIINVLGECNYPITGDEKIANREAEIYFYEISEKLPVESAKLFRYLVYYFSGSTMVINDKKTRELITQSRKEIPYLDSARLISLARSFNRFKDLWMCIKSANRNNKVTVNRISKLSKIHHEPMPENVLNNLTSHMYYAFDVIKAVKSATVFQLVRAYNALQLRQEKLSGSVFRIRNGKLWTKETAPNIMPYLARDAEIILKELRERFANKIAYVENFVDFSVPTSEKSFVGNIPEGTVLRFPTSSENFLIGVHWDNPYTDLDLRAESSGFSLGWNTNLRNSSRSLMHSGDMTRAPKPYGASEWIYFSNLTGTYNIKLNLFSGSDFSKKFKFILGHFLDTYVVSQFPGHSNIRAEFEGLLTHGRNMVANCK